MRINAEETLRRDVYQDSAEKSSGLTSDDPALSLRDEPQAAVQLGLLD